MTPEEQAHFRLLKTLEQHPDYSQREIAAVLGISLGKTNYVINTLTENGFIRVGDFIKLDNRLIKTAYLLTPKGINHRLELTQRYVERKIVEYEALRRELEILCQETPDMFKHFKEIKHD